MPTVEHEGSLWGGIHIEDLVGNPDKGFFHFDDFMWIYDDAITVGSADTQWLVGQATSGQVNTTNVIGGEIEIDSEAAGANQGIMQFQLNNESFQVLTGNDDLMVFESRVRLVDLVTDAQIFVGLGEKDLSMFSGGINTMANHIGFEMDTNDIADATKVGKLQFHSESGGTRSTLTNVHTLAEDAYVRVGFRVEKGTKVRCFVNRTEVGTITSNIPTAVMTPSFCCLGDSGTTDPILKLDWTKTAQITVRA